MGRHADRRLRKAFCSGLALAHVGIGVAGADDGAASSAEGYFEDLPIVLSVSRLPQPVDEAPGSVTIIDRDMIRRSGARDVVDLLRMVPGFQVSNAYQGTVPQTTYHGTFDESSGRMQVLIDGRSAYSPLRVGDMALGLQTLALEDIDRIEVMRGSNSAAYGARAFLGTLNIVTLSTAETRGALLSQTLGNDGINDSVARVGWGDAGASFRFTARQRGDDGLVHSFDANHGRNVNFRADFAPAKGDEVQFRLGTSALYAGVGFAGSVGNPERERRFDASYLQLDWRRSLSAEESIAVGYSHTAEAQRDQFPYKLPAPFYGTTVDFGGTGRMDVLSAQHIFRAGPDVRMVWGGELRREEVHAQPVFAVPSLKTDFQRLFGNVEWRLSPAWLANAGTMIEHNSLSGTTLAPRLALNWHFMPGQTLRAGVSRGTRPPSMFEKEANVRYVVNGVMLQETFVARGGAEPETVLAKEIAYLGDWPALRANVDARLFHERVDNLIRHESYALPPGTNLFGPQTAMDFTNGGSFPVRGGEYLAKFKLAPGSSLHFGQSFIRISTDESTAANAAPERSTSLTWFQQLPAGFDFTLGHYRYGQMAAHSVSTYLAPVHRTDLRLARRFNAGSSRCEAAVTAQNLGRAYGDYLPTLKFERRLFGTLAVRF